MTEAEEGEFIGCDIDGPSIEWATANLTPPFRFLHNGLAPPLARETGSLDLIWAMSVFTHISAGWSDWLAEMHRLLAPGGLLLASFLGEGMWEALVGDAYRDDETGMAVLRGWDGPFAWVLHSEWWLREHWGRAFDFQAVIRPGGAITHSYVVLCRHDREISPAQLEWVDPTEAREIAGLQTSLRLARRDIAHLVERETEIRAAPHDLNRVSTSELSRVLAHRVVNGGRRRLQPRTREPDL